jgi:hypothetical protein
MAGFDAVENDDTAGNRPGFDRRTFVKRVVIGTAFAVPVVTSFSMSGVNSAFAAAPSSSNTQINNLTS